MSDAPHEQYRPQEAPQAPQQLAWQPSVTDYHSFGTSALDQRTQANNALIGSGVLTDLQFDFGNMPVLAQVETNKHQGYVSNTPDLDAIDPSQLSPDAQFGGPVGNWFRYLGRGILHTAKDMSQPGAADNLIFGTAVRAKHYFEENDRAHITEDAQKALKHFAEMTPTECSKASAELGPIFFFVGAKTPMAPEAVEQLGLRQLTIEQLSRLGIERETMQMPEIPPELRHIEIQQATAELQEAMESKGRRFAVAQSGTEEMQYLEKMEASGSAGGEDNFHILLKENPSKIAILEEFLHGSQKTLGILDSMHPAIAEVRVKDFMLRHQTLLGLTDNDCVVLEALKQYEIARAKQYGFNSFEIEAKKWTNSSSK